MPWGKLDDTLYDHLKLNALGRDRMACVGLWAVAISWCNAKLTDGRLPRDQVRRLHGTIRQADRLVTAELFERDGTDYLVHDFLDFNHSRAEVLAQREAAAERKRRSRGTSRPESQRDEAPGHGGSHSPPPARVVPTRPDPTRPDQDEDAPPSGGASSAPPTRPKPNGSGPLAGALGSIAEGLLSKGSEVGEALGQVQVGLSEGEGKVFAFLARNGASIRPDSGLGIRLVGVIERRGYEVVLERAATMARSGPLSDRQWVFGLESALEPTPTGREAREADRAEADTKRADRVQGQMHARRVESFRWTGKWDPSYGPEPKWNPEWGTRPT